MERQLNEIIMKIQSFRLAGMNIYTNLEQILGLRNERFNFKRKYSPDEIQSEKFNLYE